MKEKGILELLKNFRVIITDSHIVYTSGKHGAVYINKDAIYPYTRLTSYLCREIAKRFMKEYVETVIAPTVGGVILSQWTAHHLTEIYNRPVAAVYAEKSEGSKDTFIIKRGYDKFIAYKYPRKRGFYNEQNVLVVEDVLTTGGSAKKVIEAVRAIGGEVIGLGAICNRGGITPKDVGDIPKFVALTNIEVDTWDETECPLCAKNIQINTDVGKGREFLERKEKF